MACWRYPETFDMLMMGLRLGAAPRVVVTTTPRPTAIVRMLLKASTTAVTRGSTKDNARNLPPAYLSQIVKKYEGTRLGRQELEGELLEDVPGALWTYGQIEALRRPQAPEMQRVVVAIDPAVTSTDTSDETGIVVAGVTDDGEGYVLEDLSGRYSPDAWARKAVAAYHEHKADRIVAEVNNGGDLVERILRTIDPNIAYTAVHASRGKRVRAEPVAALYEQGRIHHVGSLAVLEDQLCTWDSSTGEKSPDRLDALVWAFTELVIDGSASVNFDPQYNDYLPHLRT